MKRFKVEVSWSCTGTYYFDAEDDGQAYGMAVDAEDFPDDWDFIDGTFKIVDIKDVSKIK
jgi:hypothetical protein